MFRSGNPQTLVQQFSGPATRRRCPECGTMSAPDVGFCDACGRRFPQPRIQPDGNRIWKYVFAAILAVIVAISLRYVL